MNVILVHCPSPFWPVPQNQPLLVSLYQRGPLTANCSFTSSSPLFLSARLKPRRWRSRPRRRRRRRRRPRPTMLRRHHEGLLFTLPPPPPGSSRSLQAIPPLNTPTRTHTLAQGNTHCIYRAPKVCHLCRLLEKSEDLFFISARPPLGRRHFLIFHTACVLRFNSSLIGQSGMFVQHCHCLKILWWFLIYLKTPLTPSPSKGGEFNLVTCSFSAVRRPRFVLLLTISQSRLWMFLV